MSPLLNRLRRLVGVSTERTPDAPPSAPTSDTESEAEQKRRRRGRRGGQGRSRSSSGSQVATTASNNGQAGNATGSNGNRNNGNGNNGRAANGQHEGRVASASRSARTEGPSSERRTGGDDRRPRGYRTPRHLLDEPLPEDVAFRAPSEGGDSSILPARRRPPSGPRATSRILMPTSRYFTDFRSPNRVEQGTEADRDEARGIHPITRVETDDAPQAIVSRPDTEEDTDADGEPRKRRRRGRRGGRGRRREGAADSAETTDTETDSATDDREAADSADDLDEMPLDGAGGTSAAPAALAPERTRRARPQRQRGGPVPEAFRALGIGQTSLETLASFGFAEPTPIQGRSIPALLNGRDMVGVAQTGSGKTIAFGVPMVDRIDPTLAEVQGLVLVPTRELAQQVLDVVSDLAEPFGMKAVGLLGGHALKRDFQALEDRPQIVVGTPGRVIDHLRRGTLSLSHVSYAVLDEADEMLDIGFLPDITRILSKTPRKRQTALFSATMPMSIKRLVHRYMRDPETVTVDPELSTVDSIEQVYFEVAERDKLKGLSELVQRELKGRTLVFSRTRRGVDRLADRLGAAGIRVGALHGDMDQRRRDNVVSQFRRGELDILVATNVAARGLDIPEITHVVNFDVPQNPEEYVHRIGRTGRAGREGKAITFVCEYDVQAFDALLQQFGDRLHKERLELYA